MKLVTRAQLGWPASAAPSQASTKGVKVHYEGSPVSTKLLTDHDACIDEWKSIRASHLANKVENYSDVAYNYAACPHGYLLEGRGLGKRTGANGNQALNQAHYAIVGLVGSSGLTQPTDAMLGAIRDGIDLLRQHGAGNEIKGHRDGYATACPGPALYTWVQAGAPRPVSEEDDMPTAAEIAAAVWDYTAPNPYRKDAKGNAVSTKMRALQTSEDGHYDQVMTQLKNLGTQVTGLSAAVKALADLHDDVDTATVVAAVEAAIAKAVVKVDVSVGDNT